MKNLTELSTTDGLPLAYNRQYFTLIFRYIEPPILISGAFTNFLTIIALGTNMIMRKAIQLPIRVAEDFYILVILKLLV